ncbi:hypothetical protein [Variovorax arabinosiphilus]|uniref:hypothetical protein n=1 Tax=Variovorax arabinosiphilus TaxID=3053498 RepID=UPI00257894D6|nr:MULTISPECIES: hypothetical protein [unclassified Variovorax]MDM0119844.1 hypothetical protein [Variovorax sp. J2L1-78]MDM0128244.1 hypothetical protein [Variovorax sp. J2L1-63]MDM0231944.1 hypothetical protein [Variovorax sp. J2R1-6]
MNMLVIGVSQALVFCHTLAFAFAVVTVAREDLALLSADYVDAARIQSTGRQLVILLGLLWLTGGALILLDVGSNLAALAGRPKLLAKLSVVSLLTINGLLLHHFAFPMLTRPVQDFRRAALVCVTLGSISTVTWVYAAFVGVARIIAPTMSYGAFMALYALVLASGLAFGLAVLLPRIEQLLARHAQQDSADGVEAALRLTMGPASYFMLDDITQVARRTSTATEYATALASRFPPSMQDQRATFMRRVRQFMSQTER